MTEESIYNWYHEKIIIENEYIKYQLIAFTIVLFVELFIAGYLSKYCSIPPDDQLLPAGLLALAQCLNFLMLFLQYDANPEYVEEEN